MAEAPGTHDPNVLPPDIPAPQDDGRARHLTGLRLPDVALPATGGGMVNLSKLKGRTVVYVYPRTGVPGVDPPPGWDQIPGARGCTPQSCGFRDHFAALKALGVAQVFGLSTQATGYQQEAADRLHLPFPILSDAELSPGDQPASADVHDVGHDVAARAWRWSSRTARSSKCSIRCFRRTRTPKRSLPGCVIGQHDPEKWEPVFG